MSAKRREILFREKDLLASKTGKKLVVETGGGGSLTRLDPSICYTKKCSFLSLSFFQFISKSWYLSIITVLAGAGYLTGTAFAL